MLFIGAEEEAKVSMKSGLEGRNNPALQRPMGQRIQVSMKSGLEGRNNRLDQGCQAERRDVSMKSGLEGRNNLHLRRPRSHQDRIVSMKSGLEGRNNPYCHCSGRKSSYCLNEVRPRRPEQSGVEALAESRRIGSQ